MTVIAGNRFTQAFAATTDLGVIAYVTAGFPGRDDTASLLLACQDAGCLAVEVGIPFSDPLADGPVVQRTGWRALGNGMTLAIALRQVEEARAAGLAIPVAVMTYINPVLSYGVERFASHALRVGADAVIVPDLPADEAVDVAAAVTGVGLAHVPLVAPTTTTARLTRVAAAASGFIYCVGVTGVTGARDTVDLAGLDLLERVRGVSPLPRALGFGISRGEHLAALRGRCEAAVIGSALLSAIEAGEAAPAHAARVFLEALGR
ncbi:MAG: tryptophan synthase subunit alpha [Candidatus Dormibacteria bacterium]